MMFKGLKTKKTQKLLIGMMIILLSLIAIIDIKGYVGGILSYCFLFLFGDFYFLPIFMIIYLGINLIRNKKIKITIPYISLFIIIILLLIFNGKSSLLIEDVTPHYINMFVDSKPPFFSDYKFGFLDGGFIGYYLYSCLIVLLNENGVNIFLLIVFIICFMFSLKPLINLFVNFFYDLDDKQNKIKEDKKQIKLVDYDEIEKEEKVNDYQEINHSFNSREVVRNVSVSDFDETSVDNNEYKSTLFNDLEFGSKKESVEVKKESSFNVFEDELTFSDNKKETPVSFNCFESDIEEEYQLNKKEEYNFVNEESVKEEVKEEYQPSYINEVNIKEEVKPCVTVSDVVDDSLVKSSFDNEVKLNENINSMNIFKQSINSNRNEEEIVQERYIEKEVVKQEYVPPVENVVRHPYKLPPLSLLDDIVNEDNEVNRNEAEIKAVRLNQKLASLNINAKVIDSIVAPSFTRFIIDVASDVKLSAFNNIKQDVMMALAAEKITILAPIPGSIYVGIEIPNVKRSVVSFKEVFKEIPFKDKDEKLLAVLGKDIVGKTVTIKINKTPHLLIAGTTGSGKSVCINTIIASLLMRTSYEDVKLILVDPKRVEMAIYGDVPHLLCPVINDPIKATVALNRLCDIMTERYKMFENEGSLCRNIETYNRILKERGEKPLPYIVMIIDELSDLMLAAGKDVESSILKITQLARACGIHLIVATQRPSVDVITGVIKANLPSRIAFAVSTSADSRTILDAGGAEDLLGRGDSLVAMSGDLTMQRVQGAYVSDDEVYRVVEYVIKQRKPVFDPRFMNLEPKQQTEDFSCLGLAMDDGDDDLYQTVLSFIKNRPTVSASLLQTHFRIGFQKASRMINMLEENGVVSAPLGGAKGRKVLISNVNDEGE